MKTRTCYAVVMADETHNWITRTFTQARNAWKAARALADLTNGSVTITVVKVS